MITYEQGYYGVTFAFTLKGSVFTKSICWGVPAAILGFALNKLFSTNPELKDSLKAGDVAASILGGFTFILGFLIVFRSQQAYARWQEGGTLLQQMRGEWFNAFSLLVAFSNKDPAKFEAVREFQHGLVRLVSLLYAAGLEQVTSMHKPHFEVLELDGFELKKFAFMQTSHDRCEVVMSWVQRMVVEAEMTGVIKVAPPILSRVFNQLGNGIVQLNNARKISDFPIPFPLTQMVTFMLFCHFVITIFVVATSVESSLWAGFLSFLGVFSFWSINYIAMELENPFGEDPNDLPLHEMQSDLNKSLISLMHPDAHTPPSFRFHADIHECLRTTEVHLDESLAELHPELFKMHHEATAEPPKNLSSGTSMRMMKAQTHVKKVSNNRAHRKPVMPVGCRFNQTNVTPEGSPKSNYTVSTEPEATLLAVVEASEANAASISPDEADSEARQQDVAVPVQLLPQATGPVELPAEKVAVVQAGRPERKGNMQAVDDERVRAGLPEPPPVGLTIVRAAPGLPCEDRAQCPSMFAM